MRTSELGHRTLDRILYVSEFYHIVNYKLTALYSAGCVSELGSIDRFAMGLEFRPVEMEEQAAGSPVAEVSELEG